MSIFDRRTAFKPFEYPDVVPYKNAINHSYWLVSEWNFISDIHDFHVRLGPVEQNAIKNAMLAIAQIEVAVKKFWGRLGDRFPKPEIEQVGATFAESEVRHADAYSHLLHVLGMDDEFTRLLDIPVIQGRVDYLTKYLKGAADNSEQNYALTLTLFSIFIENVSLFSQFLVIKSFNKYLNVLKDIENVIQATQKEECYAEDTEILTPLGWRSLAEVQVGDVVYQWSNGILEPVEVLHKTARNYCGPMFDIGHSSSNCRVTPDHDMVFLNKNSDIQRKKARDIVYHSRMNVPCGGILANNEMVDLSSEERLRIAIQADGTSLYWVDKKGYKHLRGDGGGYTHSIRLTKQRKKDRLRHILGGLDVEFAEFTSGRSTEFKIRYNHNFDYKTFDWVSFIGKDRHWCNEFVQEVVEWDGYRSKTNTGYSTTDKMAADVVHCAAVLAGYRSNVLHHVDARGHKDSFKVTLSQRSIIPVGHGYKKTVVSYSGKVYCVTVPSGIILTRRLGKVCVAGNCIHALLGVCLVEHIRQERPEWFNEAFYGKLYRACHKAYQAEARIIDWIFEAGELSFLPRDLVLEFTRRRFNDSLALLGGEPQFDVNDRLLEAVSWFDDEIYSDTSVDFFHKKPVTYAKKVRSIKAKDLFAESDPFHHATILQGVDVDE